MFPTREGMASGVCLLPAGRVPRAQPGRAAAARVFLLPQLSFHDDTHLQSTVPAPQQARASTLEQRREEE